VIHVVLDTNILVSALWTPAGNASAIVELILSNKIIPCLDTRIMTEYQTGLARPKFAFSDEKIDNLLLNIANHDLFVATTSSIFPLIDESDRKFYDVAKNGSACLVTGNARHFPNEDFIMSPRKFLENILHIVL
jgi:putative PIN family toxin of toxin-antitoxin system